MDDGQMGKTPTFSDNDLRHDVGKAVCHLGQPSLMASAEQVYADTLA